MPTMRVPASKLHRPSLSRSVIDRTWLFRPTLSPDTPPVAASEDSPDAPDPPVTLLSAPAGTGKTTLMSSWAKDRAERGARVAWVSLDRNDNDPRLFWSGLLAAVRLAAGDIDAAGGAIADAAPGDDGLSEAPLVRLEILLAGSTAPMWLFLDDLQEIRSPDVLSDVDALLRGLPQGLLLVIATRSDPAVALHRLRLSGRLRDIRAADLALDRNEVRQLLVDHGVVLEEADLSLLVERTEGWAAGVRLAALTLSDVADPSVVVHRFAGDDRAVADYLATEVLARLSQRDRHLLRVCAVPEQLTPELAVAVTGEAAAAEVLDQLHRANVLVVRLTEPNGWYRVHTLLRSYLLAELRRVEPEVVPVAHRRTARWFADSGQAVWAITHAVAAEDDVLAVDVLTTHGPTLLADGRARELHQLIVGAAETVQQDPSVRRLDSLAFPDVEPLARGTLPRPRQPVDGEPAPHIPADGTGAAPLEALVALQQARHDLGLSSAALDASATVGNERDDDLGLLLALNRGAVFLLAGRLDEAEAELTAARRAASATGNGHALLRASAGLTALASSRSRYREAWELADDTVRIALRAGALGGPESGAVILQAAHSARQRLDSSAARRLAEVAEMALRGTTHPSVVISLRSLWAALDVEDGADPVDATRRLRECWNIIDGRSVPPLLAANVAFLEHRCAWLAGRPDWARDALLRLGEAVGDGGEMDVLTATEHLARGRVDAARRRLAPVLDGSVPCLLPVTLQQAWLVETLLAASAGQRARSHDALHEAVRMADEFGAFRAFLDLPGILDRLDEDASRFGRLDPVADRISAMAHQRVHHAFLSMTPKELDLLSDLPAPLTLEEIAARRQVSVNTVKTHVRSIYQKLGASSRRQAVATARHRGLL
jgi:LuxR family maltose regulon positive regulatory protein